MPGSYPISVLLRIAPVSLVLSPWGRGAQGGDPAVQGRGLSNRTPTECPLHGDTGCGSCVVVRQGQFSAQPGSLPRAVRARNRAERGQTPVIVAGSAPPAAPAALTRTFLPCPFIGPVLFSSPENGLLAFRPGVADVVGALLPPTPGRGAPWRVHGPWEVGSGKLGLVVGPRCDSCPGGSTDPALGGYRGIRFFTPRLRSGEAALARS